MLAWSDSVHYWTSVVFQTGRIGDPVIAANQCIQGVLARAGLDPHSLPGAAAWLTLSAVVVMVACLGMRRAFAASQDCWALPLNAFAALLISPMSWSHHWVWCAPALLTLADLGRRHRNRLAVASAVIGLVLFVTAPQWWLGKFAGPELKWAAWQQAIGSSYVLFAFLVLILSAWGKLTPATRAYRARQEAAGGGFLGSFKVTRRSVFGGAAGLSGIRSAKERVMSVRSRRLVVAGVTVATVIAVPAAALASDSITSSGKPVAVRDGERVRGGGQVRGAPVRGACSVTAAGDGDRARHPARRQPERGPAGAHSS